jgi:RNA polymerase sigma factor (sigma-70 family)
MTAERAYISEEVIQPVDNTGLIQLPTFIEPYLLDMPDPDSELETDTWNNIYPFRRPMPTGLEEVSRDSTSEEKNDGTVEKFISDETTEQTLVEFAAPSKRERTENEVLAKDSDSQGLPTMNGAERTIMQQVEEFLEKEGPDIMAKATRIFNTEGLVYDMEDVYQSSVVRLLEHVQSGTFQDTNIKSYLWTSIHNKFLDLARRKEIYHRRIHPLTAEQTTRFARSRYLGPEKEIMLQESMEYALDVVSRASDVDKIIIDGILDDVTYEKLGKQVGLSKNGVKARMFRFRNKHKQAQRELNEVS